MLLVFLLASFVPLCLIEPLRFYRNHRAFAMLASTYDAQDPSFYTFFSISPFIGCCGPRSATQPFGLRFRRAFGPLEALSLFG
jgi:hypothetical protein